jgi:23S rRNA pseudouridine1911/1915/1917 synthase
MKGNRRGGGQQPQGRDRGGRDRDRDRDRGGREHGRGDERGNRREASGPSAESKEFAGWVIYEDDFILAINKPAGINAQSSQGRDQDQEILQAAREYLESASRKQGGGRRGPGPRQGRVQLQIVHRIDRNSSGLLLFAKNAEMTRRLTQLFRNNQVKKQHLILVYGQVTEDKGTLKHLLMKDGVENVARIIETKGDRPKEAKEAVAHFQVEWRLPHATLLLVTMETDHSHQIRAQLAHIGHAIVGDAKYGKKGDSEGPKLSGTRLGFHAFRMTFSHPTLKKTVTIEAPLAEDLKALRQA